MNTSKERQIFKGIVFCFGSVKKCQVTYIYTFFFIVLSSALHDTLLIDFKGNKVCLRLYF